MKRIQTIFISCILATVLPITATKAQTKTTTSTQTDLQEVSLKNSKLTEGQNVRSEDILWKREAYRMVDLLNGANGALYYPVEPSPERMNLFCTIFNLIANGKLTAYEFHLNGNDGSENFTASNVLKFRDMLKKYEIPFREKPDPQKANSTIFDIDAIDIPSSEVTMFYVKEVYYLEQRNSSVRIKTLAVCPVLIRSDEVGESNKNPMFWIPFNALREALSTIPVWADSTNAVSRMNAYDFFNLHRYKGDIYKVSNLRNQTLWDYCKSPEEIKSEQLRLENELKNLDQCLWEPSQRLMLEAQAEKDAAQKAEKDAALNAERKKKATKK